MDELTTLKLSELTAHLESFFKKRFAGRKFRVVAEVSSLKSYAQKRWHFFELIEKSKASDDIVAKMGAVAWAEGFAAISRFEQETGQRFTDGLEVLLTCEVSFASRFGLKLTVSDIDAAYTLGQMERRRREILKKLTDNYPQLVQLKDGRYVTANHSIAVPMAIKRIAVVSSPGAAGYEDFIHTLATNSFGYTFTLDRYYARVQGQDAAPLLTRRLAEVNHRNDTYDLVVMIRGGGAQTDLFVFDDYELNREIARLKVALWTGIGHQRDVTIADLFCHSAHKTPTRVAEAIVQHNRASEERVLALGQRAFTSARQGVKKKSERLHNRSLTLMARVPRQMQERRDTVFDLAGRMRSSARAHLRSKATGLINVSNLLGRGGRALMVTRRQSLTERAVRVASAARYTHRRSVAAFDQLRERLPSAAHRSLKARRLAFGQMQAVLRMMHPDNMLKKGYALVVHEGKLISTAAGLPLNTALEIRLHKETLYVQLNERRTTDEDNSDILPHPQEPLKP